MDCDECRQMIEHQISRWVIKEATGAFRPRQIVLRHLDLDGRPAETLRTIRLDDPPEYGINPADVVAGHIYGIVESAQRDANARKAGMQFYTLYPKYDEYPELGHGRRKNFHAVPEEAVPEEAVPEEAAPEPASVGTP